MSSGEYYNYHPLGWSMAFLLLMTGVMLREMILLVWQFFSNFVRII